MINHLPKEKPWLSWLIVGLWTASIYSVIPLARTIQQYVRDTWGSELFAYATAAAALTGLLSAAAFVRKFRPVSRSSYLWLATAFGIVLAGTLKLGKKNPEEAIHFIQYGVLSLLVYRALTHRVKDQTVFLAAVVICGIIGTVDEFIQWLTPDRTWGLRDIGLNLFASLAVQVAMAKGLKPEIISRGFSVKNQRILCGLLLAGVLVFGTSLFMTPPRILWLANRIESLTFLKYNDSVMLEYGYRYEDPEIGVFRSRLSPEELERIDRKRAAEVAKILDWYQGENRYKLFLQFYTPISDPFAHEARVHLFRRDRYFRTAGYHGDNPEEFYRRMVIAYRENQIMEKYFHHTLHHSGYVLSREKQTQAGKYLLSKEDYDSPVSGDLVTWVREWQMALLMAGILSGLFGWYSSLSRNIS